MKELWSEINGYDGKYLISNMGRVMSTKKWDVNLRQYVDCDAVLKPMDNGNGYLYVKLLQHQKRKNVYIHRLVAEAFIPNPDNKKYVNHKDYDITNNNVDNLEWCTASENIQYSKEHMKKPKTTTHSNTGEKYITFRKSKKSFRVVINKKEYKTCKTLDEAKQLRDLILENTYE